jgi:hypothetical protein
MDTYVGLFAWALAGLLALIILAAVVKASSPGAHFIRKPLLTEAEMRVLGYLEAALPLHRVMVQVSMGALLRAGEKDQRRARATQNRFAQKIVDFVIVTRDTAEVVALIELDDRTHRAARDAKRDAMTAAAGYRTIRIPSRPRPDESSVRRAVGELATGPIGQAMGRHS